MAFTTTTLSSAVAVTDNSIVVASATGFVAKSLVRVNGEMMEIAQNYSSGTTIPVKRGQDGTTTTAHPATSNVTVGTAADFAAAPAGVPLAITYPSQPAFPLFSYSAAGALTPKQGIHIINGTGALAMTLAAPTKDQDGQIMIVVANGKAAHTVTNTAGFGANTTASDVVTFHATQTTAFMCVACNGVWVLIGFVAGAATVAGAGLA